MRRLFMTLLVGLLCATASGVLELVVPEQCALETTRSAADGACPPTCLRCHCARPYDVVTPLGVVEIRFEPAEWAEPAPAAPAPAPHDVLHVPRPAIA